MKKLVSKGFSTLKAAQEALKLQKRSLLALDKGVEMIRMRQGDIIVTGIGKSGFIGQKIAASLTSLGHRASFIHPVEAAHGDIGALSEGDVLLALSFSGESKEVVKITDYAKKNFGVKVVAFTKKISSSLGKLADVCVEVRIGKEGSPYEMAPMASTTATLVLGDMLASMLTQDSFSDKNFAKFHPGGNLGLRFKKVKDFMRKKIPLVNEGEEFIKVVKKIDAGKLGVAGVLNKKGKIRGVVTDGDLRRFLLKTKNSELVLARDIMNKNPKLVCETESLEVALGIMENYKITHLFVVNKFNKPVGIIHIHDIVEGAIISN